MRAHTLSSDRPSKLAMALCALALLIDPMHPVYAAPLTPDALIKGSTDTVYYYAKNGTRLVFPNVNTYKTWYTDFSGVFQVSDELLAAIPLGGNVTYRPGLRLIKIVSDPKVYAVGQQGTLRWLQNEEVARALYGDDWSLRVDDLSEAFFINYKVGAPISKASDFSPSNEIDISNINPSPNAAPTPSSSY